jgi:Uma2 family endonuclease
LNIAAKQEESTMAVATATRRRHKPEDEDFYPSSDGKPMAETDKHRDLMIYFIKALTIYFAQRQDVYVSGNNFLYFQEGDPTRRVSPDCYVAFGVEKRLRDSYKSWEEGGRLPSVVFEFTSRKTRKEDTQTKRPLYEQELRVPEYFLFDPTGDYLNPRLQGYRLQGAEYVELVPKAGRLHSEVLGLDLVQEGEGVRLYDPVAGEYLRTAQEEAAGRVAEKQRADQAEQRADAAEAELARLRAELEALRRNE